LLDELACSVKMIRFDKPRGLWGESVSEPLISVDPNWNCKKFIATMMIGMKT